MHLFIILSQIWRFQSFCHVYEQHFNISLTQISDFSFGMHYVVFLFFLFFFLFCPSRNIQQEARICLADSLSVAIKLAAARPIIYFKAAAPHRA